MTASFLDRLPPHERRRLLVLSGRDPEELARRRLDGEPLQYLEGTAAFLDFEVAVDERVLVPRPETEGLFEVAAAAVPDPRTIVDIGTGSGVLAIALARRFPGAEVHAVDLSVDALGLAAVNAAALGAGVALHHGDLFSGLPAQLAGRVDLAVSNPPYVSEGEWLDLAADVLHEPRMALVAGPGGTEVLARIARQAAKWLVAGGFVVCEIGETQSDAVMAMFSPLGPTFIEDDLRGRPRYVLSRKSE